MQPSSKQAVLEFLNPGLSRPYSMLRAVTAGWPPRLEAGRILPESTSTQIRCRGIAVFGNAILTKPFLLIARGLMQCVVARDWNTWVIHSNCCAGFIEH